MRLKILILFGFLAFGRYVSSQCHPDDFYSLRALYLSTDGDNWTDTAGWSIVRNNVSPPVNCALAALSGINTYYSTENFGRVREVVLSGRGLKDTVPQEFFEGLEFLERIYFYNNEISYIEDHSRNDYTELTNVNIAKNNLTLIPTILLQFDSLESLDLSNNFFFEQSLPPEIGDLSNLEKLVINESSLGGALPKEIGNLTKLIELSLKQNLLIGAIPKEIGNLTQLQELFLNSPKTNIKNKNQLTGELPKEIGNLVNLRFLSLGNNNFKSPLPSEIGGLENLYRLDLFKSNFIGPIPPEIGNLSKLLYFRGSFNAFTSLPSEIGQCSQLQTLELSVTLIDSIPSGIGGLDSLTRLSLTESMVSYVDPDIGGLGKLTYLSLSSNPLQSIPDEIGLLENLETLSFYACELTDLPQSIEDLDKLKSLDLSINWLSGHVPCQIGNMDSLAYVDLKYNNFSGCLDTTLLSLCGASVGIGGYEDIFGRGNNLPDWDQFCSDTSYSCPGYIDTVQWELYDTSVWSLNIIWEGRQVPMKYQHVVLPQIGDPMFTTGASRVLELPEGAHAQVYTLEIENGVEFLCPQGSTLEILTEQGYNYQSTCGN